MKINLILTLLLFLTFKIAYSQTPITDDNFSIAIETCLSTNPVDGLCSECEYGAMPDWDVSAVTDMEKAFQHKYYFNADISQWDVSSAENMNFMFNNANNFNQDISNWDVSNVTTMVFIFYSASIFNQDIGSWDVSNVTNMSRFFTLAGAFNQDLSEWDVSKVTDMAFMFAATPFDQDIGNWDVSSVIDFACMFNLNYSFNQDISGWCVEQTTDPGCFAEESLNPEYYPHWGEDCTTDIDNSIINESYLVVSPNPATKYLNIYWNNNEIEKLKELNIIDRFGKSVIRVNGSPSERLQIDINELPIGLYFIQAIDNNDITYTRKFVKTM